MTKQPTAPRPAPDVVMRWNKSMTLELFLEACRLAGVDPKAIGAKPRIFGDALNDYVTRMARKAERAK